MSAQLPASPSRDRRHSTCYPAWRSTLATAGCTRSRIRAVLVTALIAGCAPRSTPDLLDTASAELGRRAPDACRVRLDTSKGSIVLEMRREWAPHGVDRFYNLVRAGYYDDTAVFRVRAGVWAQFGIHGKPAVAQHWRTSSIPDDSRVLSNTRGTVAYAFKEPHGRTTQVFINLRDNSAAHDTEPFVPFARVVEGCGKAGPGVRRRECVFAPRVPEPRLHQAGDHREVRAADSGVPERGAVVRCVHVVPADAPASFRFARLLCAAHLLYGCPTLSRGGARELRGHQPVTAPSHPQEGPQRRAFPRVTTAPAVRGSGELEPLGCP